jgi:hypothetical protein
MTLRERLSQSLWILICDLESNTPSPMCIVWNGNGQTGGAMTMRQQLDREVRSGVKMDRRIERT